MSPLFHTSLLCFTYEYPVCYCSQTKMPPNQETIRFEDLKAFPIKTKQQF
jgi:hypothetical protein